MKHLGYIADGFGTENVKGRLLETDFYTFRQNIDSWLDKQTIELN